MNKTFTDLLVLQQTRETAQSILKEKYTECVQPFINIIQKVMTANDINHFEAMKQIQDKTKLSDPDDKKIMFAAALMEIVENKNIKL